LFFCLYQTAEQGGYFMFRNTSLCVHSGMFSCQEHFAMTLLYALKIVNENLKLFIKNVSCARGMK